MRFGKVAAIGAVAAMAAVIAGCGGKSEAPVGSPAVTPHEMRHLDRQLPASPTGSLNAAPIPQKEANRYAKFYRYLPNFASFER